VHDGFNHTAATFAFNTHTYTASSTTTTAESIGDFSIWYMVSRDSAGRCRTGYIEAGQGSLAKTVWGCLPNTLTDISLLM
jgi:hypothetical protein